MGNALNPTVLQRVSRALRPDFARTVLARRIAAGALVILAAAAAVRPDPTDSYAHVVTASRDLSPGVVLSADDVGLQRFPSSSVPDGASGDPGALTGATLAGPVRRGEVLTDARVLGSRLTGLSAGADARLVPLHLADAAVLDVVRAGDVVDVLGAADTDPGATPRVLASNAVVVTVSAASRTPGADGRVVLIALPAGAAHAVAGASLVQTVTLTLH